MISHKLARIFRLTLAVLAASPEATHLALDSLEALRPKIAADDEDPDASR